MSRISKRDPVQRRAAVAQTKPLLLKILMQNSSTDRDSPPYVHKKRRIAKDSLILEILRILLILLWIVLSENAGKGTRTLTRKKHTRT